MGHGCHDDARHRSGQIPEGVPLWTFEILHDAQQQLVMPLDQLRDGVDADHVHVVQERHALRRPPEGRHRLEGPPQEVPEQREHVRAQHRQDPIALA
eukprot:4731711-Alexandrium_andersonii.AAC.1